MLLKFNFIVLGLAAIYLQLHVTFGSFVPGLLSSHNRLVVCYVSSWAAYRPGRGAFSLDDLDPQLCTHLVYAFAGLNITSGMIRPLDPFRDLEEDYGLGWYKKLTSLKNRFPHLKTTLAIGGWNEGSENYSKMAADSTLRRAFVDSILRTLQKYHFDGVDLDWEFPGSRGGAPIDKINFVTVVKELRSALAPRGLIVTAALGAGRATIDSGYDIAALGSLLDHMHVMCYDYHGAWDSQTSPNAPLNSDDTLSVMSTIEYLKLLGAPAHKIVLGVPMYGRTFNLIDGSNSDAAVKFGTPTTKEGFAGPFTREAGFMGYNELCLELNGINSTWKKSWHDQSKTPYAQNGKQWLTYDDERSVAEKAYFAVKQGLGGVMVWAIDTDDFHGDCSATSGIRRQYPLVTALNTAMTKAVNEMGPEDNSHDGHNNHISRATLTSVSLSIFAFVIASLVL